MSDRADDPARPALAPALKLRSSAPLPDDAGFE